MNQIKKNTCVTSAALILLLALSGSGADEESHSDQDHDSVEHQHGGDMPEAHMPHMIPEADDHTMDHHSANPAMEKPADARKITIIATDFTFDPATITAKPGEKLFIELINKGNAVHMWQLEGKHETHVHTATGETSAKVVIAPQKAGSYELVCSTPGHVQLGMVGTLKVE
jgi:plastocyanin